MSNLMQDYAHEIDLARRGIAVCSKVPTEGAAVGAIDVRLSRVQITAVQGIGGWHRVPSIGNRRS